MNPSRMARGGISVLLFSAVLTALPQVPNSTQSGEEIKAEEKRFYGDARPYMDEPQPVLKNMVYELRGLKPAPSSELLPNLLNKVGAKADELLRKVPDLISEEAVTQTQWPVSAGTIPGCIGIGCNGPGSSSGREQEFDYIILTHPTANGRLTIEEYRRHGNGKPLQQGEGAPAFQGFAAAWVIFSSWNQVESRFRLLGTQRTHGHDTLVIGFAQIPGSIEHPGKILSERGSVPMLLQGVAWIDRTDFRILRIRTDLLAPQPEIEYQEQTSSLAFGQVHIADLDLVLWLPQTVDAEMEASGQHLSEQHLYSKYRLYQSKTKIIMSPN